MAGYLAEVDEHNVVTRVIVCDDIDWARERLGGTWAPTADPYDPTDTRVYAGVGMHYDPATGNFAAPWEQREYALGELVWHNGKLYASGIDANATEPGTPNAGWQTS